MILLGDSVDTGCQGTVIVSYTCAAGRRRSTEGNSEPQDKEGAPWDPQAHLPYGTRGDYLPESYLEFLGALDAIGAGARYPKDLAATLKAYSRDVAKRYLDKTEEFLEWLKREFMLQL